MIVFIYQEQIYYIQSSVTFNGETIPITWYIATIYSIICLNIKKDVSLVKYNFDMQTDRITPEWITDLNPDEIFVFESNSQGHHNGGAARTALKWGAIYGQGEGLQGQTYAIPTMFASVQNIVPYADRFIEFARLHPEMKFLLTEIGCGIAGFSPKDIAPLFKKSRSIENIYLPQRFWSILDKK